MKVRYVTLNANNKPVMQEIADSSRVLVSLRELMIGETKLETELYCLQIMDGNDPCIIILRNLDDRQIAEGLAVMSNASQTKLMACIKKPI